MYISLNGDTVKNKNSEVASKIEDFYNHINELLNTISEISSIWEGSDYDNFLNEMNEFCEQLKRLNKSVEGYRDFVKGYVMTSEKIDEFYKKERIKLI